MSSDSQLRPGESRAGDPRSGEPRAAASRPEPSPTPFERLVRILRAGGGSADGPDLGALAELGAPSTLDRLLRAALVAAVRRGPSSEREGWGPARLLDAAERGAGAGAVPASTAPRLRATLAELEAELHDRCLWDPSTSLWWHPLPPPGPMEAIWRTLEERFSEDAPGADPERLAGLGGALPGRAGAGSPGWLVLPSALPEAVARRVHRELVAAEEAGVLALARGGVGAGDRASEVRTDRVTYRSGLEPELLRQAPAVAVLVQWLLGRLPERVGAFSPSGSGSALHAPATAMLARYRAPCRGFAPHVDNPGGRVDGAEDNGRALSLVLYLNEPDAPCAGGEIALWRPDLETGETGETAETGAAGEEPAEVLPARGGSAVLFDSRRVLHAVRPLRPGPDRWTLVVWLSDAPRPPDLTPEPPAPTAAEVLEALETGRSGAPDSGAPAVRVPVPPGRVLLRSLRDGALRVESVPVAAGGRPRIGFVCTSHRAGPALETWCRHHLELGADHLLVVLDEVATPDDLERARSLASGSSGRVTVWSPAEAAAARAGLANVQPGFEGLLEAAGRGTATDAVAARQTLNATAALRAARSGGLGEADGEPLDWLVHLDSDELFHLERGPEGEPEGRARGGADLAEHFAALAAAGRTVVRYVNHELLLSGRSGPAGGPGAPRRFKLNPRLAAVRLGPVGWRRLMTHLGLDPGLDPGLDLGVDQELEREGSRPYFRAYWNGKSAVAVAAGCAAAGVHGWYAEGAEGAGGEGAAGDEMLLGPSVLHLHLPSREAFREKYLTVARAPGASGERAFPPSPLEERAVGAIREALRGGGGEDAAAARLDALYDELLRFEGWQVELLEEAGLVVYLQAKTGSS